MQGGARGFWWSIATLAVLLWPAKIPGTFDGAPLDGGIEAVVVGLVVPSLAWFYGAFFKNRFATIAVIALALVRIADAQMTQGGWCVRFDTPAPIVKDSTGRIHSWDVRADWRSADPACSAVITSGYHTFKRFPAWFYNLPPTDNNPPTADDRPPYATLKMTVLGFIDARESGALDLQVGRYTTTSMIAGGRPAEPNGEGAYRVDMPDGLHLVQIESTLHGNQWRFMPSWNQTAMGATGFPLVTMDRPGARDRGPLRSILGWSATWLAAGIVIAWLTSALRAWGDLTTLAWAALASIWLAYVAPRAGNDYVTSDVARWSLTALGLAAFLPVRERLRTLRGAFVVLGIPWLVFIGVAAFDHVAKFSFYAGGDDQWTFQRFAYRIYLQGYWLEGGERTFWFQPGYRWIAGAWHMVFGDSSLGEFHWDGICLAIMMLFAHEAVSRTAGFKWGLAAAATVLTLVMQGPPWSYWGVGLSENAAAGFIYAAALAAILAQRWQLRFAAGVLATLAFYARLNNLPLAFAVAAFAVPMDVRVRELWSPNRLLNRISWSTAAWIVGVIASGIALFALRTWYVHGTLLGVSRHHARHLVVVAAWSFVGAGGRAHDQQPDDGAVDERPGALLVVCNPVVRRRGVFDCRRYRSEGSSRASASVGFVLSSRVFWSARGARRRLLGALLDGADWRRRRGIRLRCRPIGGAGRCNDDRRDPDPTEGPGTSMSMIARIVASLTISLIQSPLPSGSLSFGVFTARFDPGGTFELRGEGWPAMSGTWETNGEEISFSTPKAAAACQGPGRYRFGVAGPRLTFSLVADNCVERRMILDRSTWMPTGTAPPPPARRIVRTAGPKAPPLAGPSRGGSHWPSFRGSEASGVSDGQKLPDRWDAATGENVMWRTPIAGLAHSSPIVWGDVVFVTSAVSSRKNATFKPGLYGDGDASDDRSPHRWVIYAVDKRSGAIRWERTAAEGEPLNKRHIKSTYASATPATDGRIVVAWFGSHGVYAYDFAGNLRWKVDLGRVDMGAYDIPTYEWGPASSPIIWNGLVIIQCDTQTDSFLLALNAETGETVWKTDRQELPSWGTPTVVDTSAGPQLVTNASNFIRGYDPKTGKELWRIGGSSKITAPTPIFAQGLHIVASGRRPERPIFAINAGARGDVTLSKGATESGQVAWSKTGRGSYMPTPIAYGGVLYVLDNSGVFDAYELATGKEIYRQRLPLIGSGYSASPIAADGKIYLSNEDGDMLVVEAGSVFKLLATNSMGEMLMATPALSDGVMYVRGTSSLFAIARRP